MKKRPTGIIECEESSGNVFADLGFADAKERYVKVALSIMIGRIIKQRKLTQAQAAAILGTTQAKVSTVCTSRLQNVSLEKLLEFLTRLDRDVEITICPKPRKRAMGELTVALEA